MTAPIQVCSNPDCSEPAAFTTRTKPAWCLACLERILAKASLRPVEPFPGKATSWWLTRCTSCGDISHYRLETIVAKNAGGETVCGACFWDEWSRRAGSGRLISADDLASLITENGYVSNVTISGHAHAHDTISLTCRRCERRIARLVRDIGWGCDCSKNQRRTHPTDGPSRAGMLLRESQSPALRWWDHNLNTSDVFAATKALGRKPVWWRCPDCDHSFQARTADMRAQPTCPECIHRANDERQQFVARMMHTPVSAVSELRFAWADDANPATVMVTGSGMYKFRCPAGHTPTVRPLLFLESGCPPCRANRTRQNQKMVADLEPELASQWHPTLNGNRTPENTVWDSKSLMWWRSDCCGHEWQATPRDRDKYSRLRCPACKVILGSLAWTDPGLAMEWDAANRDTAWHVAPGQTLPYEPSWVCATNSTHQWTATLSSRGNGSECPDCRVGGKSRIELAHLEAARAQFTSARSGAKLKSEAFTTRKHWTVDISFDHDGEAVVVEYDGAYWHRAEAKVLVDARKTLDLLAAGYRVVRLREDDLAHLELTHLNLLQLNVLSSAPRPAEVMSHVRAWLTSQGGPVVVR